MSLNANDRPAVSVITSFLNAAKFIEEAIASVLNQTYNSWELLLIDDGSDDASSEIARKHAARRPEQIRYLEHSDHRNLGVAASRNLGIREAKGDYIALLDADDVWIPCKLEEQLALLTRNPRADGIHGVSLYWKSWEGNSGSHRDVLARLPIPPNSLVAPPILLAHYHPLRKAFAPCVSSLVVRREMVVRIGGFEERFRGVYQLYEDQAFLAKLYAHAHLLVAEVCWDKYRLHAESCCAVWKMPHHQDSARLFFLNWFAEYMAQVPVCDRRVRQALKRAFWEYRHPLAYSMLRSVSRIVRYAGFHSRTLRTNAKMICDKFLNSIQA